MALPKLNAPKYEMTVPSTGEKISYRPYLVKEEKILMMAMESDDANQMITAVKNVISACTEGALDVDKMTMFDLEYAFVQLRSKSVGESTTIGVKCNSCDAKNDVDIDLSDVQVDVPNEKNANVIQLTDTVGVKMRYPSVDTVMSAQAKSEGSDSSAASEVENVFDLLVACMDSIYSGDEIFDADQQDRTELLDFLESLNTEQFGRVKDFVENMPTASVTVDFKCVSCSAQNKFDVKGIANFFG